MVQGGQTLLKCPPYILSRQKPAGHILLFAQIERISMKFLVAAAIVCDRVPIKLICVDCTESFDPDVLKLVTPFALDYNCNPKCVMLPLCDLTRSFRHIWHGS